MARSKKESKKPVQLVRSDKNLLAFGLFGAALLIGVFLYFDYFDIPLPTYIMNVQGERTYRVESVPASISEETPIQTQETDDADTVNAEEDLDVDSDY